MQGWLVAGAWIFAVLLALVVLGFAGYELAWKTRRLNADKVKLDRVVAGLTGVAAELQTAAERAQRVLADRADPAGPSQDGTHR